MSLQPPSLDAGRVARGDRRVQRYRTHGLLCYCYTKPNKCYICEPLKVMDFPGIPRGFSPYSNLQTCIYRELKKVILEVTAWLDQLIRTVIFYFCKVNSSLDGHSSVGFPRIQLLLYFHRFCVATCYQVRSFSINNMLENAFTAYWLGDSDGNDLLPPVEEPLSSIGSANRRHSASEYPDPTSHFDTFSPSGKALIYVRRTTILLQVHVVKGNSGVGLSYTAIIRGRLVASRVSIISDQHG